jgi:hypothetical protein
MVTSPAAIQAPRISISKADLRKCIEKWEAAYRNGECMSTETVAALSVEQVADRGADYLWTLLRA